MTWRRAALDPLRHAVGRGGGLLSPCRQAAQVSPRRETTQAGISLPPTTPLTHPPRPLLLLPGNALRYLRQIQHQESVIRLPARASVTWMAPPLIAGRTPKTMKTTAAKKDTISC